MFVAKPQRVIVGNAAETAVTVGGISRYLTTVSIYEQNDNGDPFRLAFEAGQTADNGKYAYVGQGRGYDIPASGEDPFTFYLRLDQAVSDQPFAIIAHYRD